MTPSKPQIAGSLSAIAAGVLLAVAVAGGSSSSPARQIDVQPRDAIEAPSEPSTVAPAPADAQPTTTAPSKAQEGPGPRAADPAPTVAPSPQPTATTTCHLTAIPTNPNGTPAGPPQQICG